MQMQQSDWLNYPYTIPRHYQPLDGDVLIRFPEFLKEHLDGNWIIKFLRKLKGGHQWCVDVQW